MGPFPEGPVAITRGDFGEKPHTRYRPWGPSFHRRGRGTLLPARGRFGANLVPNATDTSNTSPIDRVC
jgi:hypothetical protein